MHPRQGIILFLLAFATQALPGAEEGRLFRFKLEENDVLSVDKYQDIRIGSGQRWESREEKNRIILRVISEEDDTAIMRGAFLTYSRTPREVGEFRQDRTFLSQFKIHPDGRYEVPDEYIMPNLRGMPTFPAQPILPGHTWEADALETMDFSSVKLRLPVRVRYRYTGPSLLQLPDGTERELPRFEYVYSFDHPVGGRAGLNRIIGFSSCEFWFDPDAGVPVFDSNRLVYQFVAIDGSLQEAHFRIDSWYHKGRHMTEDERGAIVAELEDELAENENLSVRETNEGVALDLNAILFAHDTADLSTEASRQVAIIAEILKRYPRREIRISGHTDNTGSRSYNQTLSEARARSVVRELQRLHSIDGRRLSYRGFGETQPVAPNSTQEGRQRNRRVEVLIVTD